MAILEGIKIQNYRALKDITLGKVLEKGKTNMPLPKLIAIIGENGTGKSSILDALGFIGNCLTYDVEKACDTAERGGFEKLRSQGVNEPIKFEIRYRENDDAAPINYTLEIDLDTQTGRPYVSLEKLLHRRKEQFGNNFAFINLKNGKGKVWSGVENDDQIPFEMKKKEKLAISNLSDLVNHPRISEFTSFLSGWYLSYFSPEKARSQSNAGADPHLNRDGSNLSNYLEFIERNEPSQFKKMLTEIAQKIPGLTKIESTRTEDKRLLLKFTAQGYTEPFYHQNMSDGTLKMLAYLLLMKDPNPRSLIGIEEPENGLHHQLLEDLAYEFKQCAEQKSGPQILLTTHSPNLVDGLKPHEVWILRKNKNGFSELINCATIEGVSELAEDIPMGSLWYSNHLNGRS